MAKGLSYLTSNSINISSKGNKNFVTENREMEVELLNNLGLQILKG
jgi:hypothetical protein